MNAWMACFMVGFASNLQTSYSPEDVLGLIDASQRPITSLQYEFEGEFWTEEAGLPSGELDPGSAQDRFSGLFLYKAPDLYLCDIYHEFRWEGAGGATQLRRQTLLCRDGIFHDYSRNDDSAGGGETRAESIRDMDNIGSYGRIYLIRTLRQFLVYPKQRTYVEGTEIVDDHECLRVAIVVGKPPYDLDSPETTSYRFWIDLSRNANVVRAEKRSNGELVIRDDIQLERIDGDGEPIWVPVSGRHDLFTEGERTAFDTCRVLHGTMRVNTEIATERFDVDYKIGTLITDRLKNAVFEYGQDRRPPPKTTASAETRLEEALEQAERTRTELEASSWSRNSPRGLLWMGPLALSFVAILALVVVWIRRQS